VARQGGRLAAGTGLAGIAATALGLSAGQYWLATPVHLVAGLDTVRLHPQGLLRFDDSHARQLETDFARVFAGSGWQLHATGARDLLLSAPATLAVTSTDPVEWLGDNPRAGLPQGADARALRTLATEIEMWLHGHAVNRERAAARQLGVSGLWLWGGGRSSAPPATASGRLYSDDLVARSLWAGGAAAVAPLPAGWAELRSSQPATAHETAHVVLDFEAIEDRWLAPLLAEWQSGRVARIELVAGRQRHELRAPARWRFWSRPRPWWERLGA
jgi:hypothetical protein